MSYFITDDYMKRNRAMAIPGAYWDRQTQSYRFDEGVTPRTALVAIKMFPELAVQYPDLVNVRDNFVQDIRPLNYAQEWWDARTTHERAHALRAVSVMGNMEAEGMNYWPFQRTDLAYLAQVLRQHKSAYLGWERGLGKTLGSISLMDDLRPERVLVISSNTAKTSVWQPELTRWGRGWMAPQWVIPNEKVKRERHLEWMQANRHKPQVGLVHYQALNIIANTRAGRQGWKRFGKWDLIVTDEFHHFSNKNAQQTHALKLIPTELRLGVSGSIISNHALEIFSQLNWLFGQGYTRDTGRKASYTDELRDYADRFLDYVDLEGHREYIGVRLDRVDALRRELGVFLTYRRKEDELDLPPILTQDIPVTLGKRQRRTYDDMARDAIAFVDGLDGPLTAANGLALLTKLRQIATGLNLVSDLVDSAKLDAAVDIVRDNPDEAFVVFSYFVGAAEALASRLEAVGVKTFTVHQGVKIEDRTDFINRFQAGEGRVFVGTLGTLGESVTLSRASNVLFLDRSWNPELNNQAVDRVAGGFRALQVGRPITITNLVSEGTVDETQVTPTLSSKAAVRAVILGRRNA
jgi:SNF2 family DNA or RNA helicase